MSMAEAEAMSISAAIEGRIATRVAARGA